MDSILDLVKGAGAGFQFSKFAILKVHLSLTLAKLDGLLVDCRPVDSNHLVSLHHCLLETVQLGGQSLVVRELLGDRRFLVLEFVLKASDNDAQLTVGQL